MERKINLIFCIPSSAVGGIQNHLARQIPLFDPQRYVISVVLISPGGKDAMREVLPQSVEIHECLFKNIYDIFAYKKLWVLLRKLTPDIVVTSAFDANAIFRLMQPFFGYAAVPRLHSLYLDQPPHVRMIDWFLSLRTRAIVAVSRGVAAHAARTNHISSNRFVVIENGIDLNEIEAFNTSESNDLALRAELGLRESEKVVLTVCRLRSAKNIPLAIDAFARFLQSPEGASYTFVIVGDGVERGLVEERIRHHHIEEKVVITGMKKNTFAYYRIADMFLMTSIREGFPNVLLESMAFGVPFVSTRVPGVVDVIKDGVNGYLADSTPEDLASKMVGVAQLGSQTMREACKASVIPYDMKENVRRYEALFKRLRPDKYEG